MRGDDRVGIYFLEKEASLRSSISASENNWSGILLHGGAVYHSSEYNITIVDRVGGGDSFSAGLIYGFLSGKTPTETISFAVAASCLKHSIEGDFNHVSSAEVEALASGDVFGRILR